MPVRAVKDLLTYASCLIADEAGRLVDAATAAKYVPTYEDKDIYWMLVEDVPFK